MPRISMNLTAPIFRHFFPVIPDAVTLKVPAGKPQGVIIKDMSAYLIQGANPLDKSFMSTDDKNTRHQFQGGYRCTLEIVTPPDMGRLIVSSSGLSFEYTPPIGYVGKDIFCYQIVNVMGQYSDYGYMTIFIRC